MWYHCRSFREKPGDEIKTILNTYTYTYSVYGQCKGVLSPRNLSHMRQISQQNSTSRT